MKRDRKHRYLLGIVVIAMGPQTRADEPVEWCQTYVNWAANTGNQRATAQGECPTEGTCDIRSVRDSWIPGPSTPIVHIRLRLHIFCNDDGTNCASSPSEVAAQMTQLNSDYAPYRIQFTGQSEYINASAYRNFLYTTHFGMKTTYADDPAHQINVYVVNVLVGFLGLGTFPWDPNALGNLGGIVMHQGVFGAGQKTLTHEVGHNLGLWHTHHGVSEVDQCSACWERADGVNGDTTGDFASDTPPTPTNYASCLDPTTNDPCRGKKGTFCFLTPASW